MPESLYAALGLGNGASDAEIKKAYRELARELHPDVKPGDAAAEERFKKINAAYEVLGDADKRKLYDEFGHDSTRPGFDADRARQHKRWQQQGPWHQAGGVNEQAMYEQLFGRRGPRKGRERRADIELDFRTAVLGGEQRIVFGDGQQMTVRIPAGVSDGGDLRLRGKGHRSMNGGPNGDLVLTLHIGTDPVFRREKMDLHVDLPITVVEAIRGAAVELPLLEGSVKLRIPPASQTGQKLRLKGKGVVRKGKRTGDLFVHLQVHVPEELDDETLDKLEAAYSSHPRESDRADGDAA